ncbi:hypothetical protein [Cryptosporangium minutisporangium]|uniref:Uncharacterized protein n=1 Tax=Cryptosporangium minutisporangium TaxID=113569 RepID=A0ABP6SZQ0_9ACTN
MAVYERRAEAVRVALITASWAWVPALAFRQSAIAFLLMWQGIVSVPIWYYLCDARRWSHRTIFGGSFMLVGVALTACLLIAVGWLAGLLAVLVFAPVAVLMPFTDFDQAGSGLDMQD